ncbi:response regulator transcription factor [Ekhidna sp.]|uniref:response regulator transcription factor n=1 Tax=Ekhidna sp. TaxID=2608089 RepID=UPI003C7D47FA
MSNSKEVITLDSQIDWQRDRAFKGFYEEVNLEEYAKKFEGNPNEAYHILDAQTFELTMAKNSFDKVFKIPGFHPKTAVDILHLIHEDHQPQVYQFMQATLANEGMFELGKDSVSQVYMLCNGLMILKTSTPLIADSNKHIIYVLEQYRDVTDLVPLGKYTWRYNGPNQKRITKVVEKSLGMNCPLSTQELTVLSLVGKGLSSQQAADTLFISKHTVDTHRRNIIRKLEVENSTEAYQKARVLGILT